MGKRRGDREGDTVMEVSIDSTLYCPSSSSRMGSKGMERESKKNIRRLWKTLYEKMLREWAGGAG
jgi:hypothetical protein